jgi:hypothetical protein
LGFHQFGGNYTPLRPARNHSLPFFNSEWSSGADIPVCGAVEVAVAVVVEVVVAVVVEVVVAVVSPAEGGCVPRALEVRSKRILQAS